MPEALVAEDTSQLRTALWHFTRFVASAKKLAALAHEMNKELMKIKELPPAGGAEESDAAGAGAEEEVVVEPGGGASERISCCTRSECSVSSVAISSKRRGGVPGPSPMRRVTLVCTKFCSMRIVCG